MTEKANVALCHDERNKSPLLFPWFGSVTWITAAAEVLCIDVFIVLLLRLSFVCPRKMTWQALFIPNASVGIWMANLSEETKVEKGSSEQTLYNRNRALSFLKEQCSSLLASLLVLKKAASWSYASFHFPADVASVKCRGLTGVIVNILIG